MNETVPEELIGRFWLISADMGYGHQRAIYPLKSLAVNGEVLNANTSRLATSSEKRLWRHMLSSYELMSRASKFPLVGKYIKRVLDKLLYIPKPYTSRDLTLPSLQVKHLKRAIGRGLCRGVVEEISSLPLPLITSFYSSAIAAEMASHPKVYCIICDTDINRVWAPEDSENTRIHYFAPNSSSARRLAAYGVPYGNIHTTGFPLPVELLGDRKLNVLRQNLCRRLQRLDPSRKYQHMYQNVGLEITPINTRVLTITYCVGGAGAQKEIGRQFVKSLRKKIKKGFVKVNLVAGTRVEVRDYFLKVKETYVGESGNIRVIYAPTNDEYFKAFNDILHETDILWTKPSELSFYCALGIPIIMTQAIGPQEKCNRRWLMEIGAGLKQHDPSHAKKWIFDLLNKGVFAEAALHGFIKAHKCGTYNIFDYLQNGYIDEGSHKIIH